MSIDGLLFSYVVSEETYEPGSVIHDAGKRGQWVYLMLEGAAKEVRKSPRGIVTLRTLKAGDVFGEMTLFLDERKVHEVSSFIAENHVRVGILDNLRLVREYGGVSSQLKDLIRSLVNRLQETNKMAVELATKMK